MYASVLTYDLQPGKRDTAIALSNSPVGKEIETLFKAIPGFKGYLGLIEVDADKVIGIVLYETEADAEAAANSPKVKELWSKVIDLVNTETIDRTVCQVTFKI